MSNQIDDDDRSKTFITTANVPQIASKIKSNLRQWFNKSYLGGFKHKQNGMEYFHAETQTLTAQELRNEVSLIPFGNRQKQNV